MSVCTALKREDLNRGDSRFKVPSSHPNFDLYKIVLDPIPTTHLTAKDVDQLATETRAKMLEVLLKISPQTDAKSVNGTTEESKKEL